MIKCKGLLIIIPLFFFVQMYNNVYSTTPLTAMIDTHSVQMTKCTTVHFRLKNNTHKNIYVLAVGKEISYLPYFQENTNGQLIIDYSLPENYVDGDKIVYPYTVGNGSPSFIRILPGEEYYGKIKISNEFAPLKQGVYSLKMVFGYNYFALKDKKFISIYDYSDWAKTIQSNTIKLEVR